jgi:hypothetical protein
MRLCASIGPTPPYLPHATLSRFLNDTSITYHFGRIVSDCNRSHLLSLSGGTRFERDHSGMHLTEVQQNTKLKNRMLTFLMENPMKIKLAGVTLMHMSAP